MIAAHRRQVREETFRSTETEAHAIDIKLTQNEHGKSSMGRSMAKKKTKKGAKMIIQAAEKVSPQGKGEKEVSGNIKKNQPNNNTTF